MRPSRSSASFLRGSVLLGIAFGTPSQSWAAEVPADPTNYRDLLPTLAPGDTLVLSPGTYTRLTIQDLHGTANAWITITGPDAGDPAVIVGEGGSNTVQFYRASYVAVRNLTIDVLGEAVDAVNSKDGVSHDILIENNIMQGFPGPEASDIAQQVVGVNTKDIVWHWTIRGNTIVEPGTGLYLGGSEGDAQFIAGVVENNLVVHPLGYCMQIKQQNSYELMDGMPPGPNRTIIRNNVFIKDDRPSPDGDRPNLLVGGFPDSGPGAEDIYEVYGNLLFYNPREALFQPTGRISIHDNIFISAAPDFPAIALQGHQGKSMKVAHVYNNTIFTDGRGITLAEAASESDAIVGNLVFSPDPVSGSIADERDNLVASVTDAAMYVNAPGTMLGAIDFYPLRGAVQGTPLDLSKFGEDEADELDFNGLPKGDFTFRGAYAGAGGNPGCPLAAEIDRCDIPGDDTGSGDGSGGSSGVEPTGDGSSGRPDTTAAPASDDGVFTDTTFGGDTDAESMQASTSGCSCSNSPCSGEGLTWALLCLAGWAGSRPRRRRRSADHEQPSIG